jgi:hypothetical protein
MVAERAISAKSQHLLASLVWPRLGSDRAIVLHQKLAELDLF